MCVGGPDSPPLVPVFSIARDSTVPQNTWRAFIRPSSLHLTQGSGLLLFICWSLLYWEWPFNLYSESVSPSSAGFFSFDPLFYDRDSVSPVHLDSSVFYRPAVSNSRHFSDLILVLAKRALGNLNGENLRGVALDRLPYFDDQPPDGCAEPQTLDSIGRW